ncbi:purine nucleoside metabolic process [Homalodisca vitripennis]|nr:purine nucleoside metabolic process [Homalodisca vitripennis]
MVDVIRLYQGNKSVGFAHSISADFQDPRHMSAGVAVVFKRLFGKPQPSQCMTGHLAIQDRQNRALIFSLITKLRYYSKPTLLNYDTAFQDLTKNFMKRRLRHLICSPIGCVRDNVDLAHFINNIVQFQNTTKARVTYPQMSSRILRKGIPHEDFVEQLRNLVTYKTPVGLVPKYAGKHLEATVPMEGVALAMGGENPTIDLTGDPSATITIPSQSEEVPVVPGDLSYSESLKQSSVNKEHSAVINVVNTSVNGFSVVQSPDSSLNLQVQAIPPIT